MNKLLKTSLCMILIGFILSVIGFLAGGRFHEISITTNGVRVYDTNKDKNIVKESFNLDSFNKVNISSNFDLSYIEIVKGDKYKLDLQYDKENKIDYSIKDGVLTINYNSKNEKNIINFGFFNNTLEEGVKLYVPEDCNLDELTVNTSSSDIKIDKVNSKDIDIVNGYGDIDLLNSSCENIVLKASSGDINLSDIKSTKISFENDYGEVNIKNSNFEDFNGNLSSGDFQANNINISKECNINNSYGSIEMENSSLGNFTGTLNSGDLEFENIKEIKNVNIENDYGDVEIKGKLEYNKFNYYLKCEYGTIELNDKEYDGNYKEDNKAEYNINITATSGDIDIEF